MPWSVQERAPRTEGVQSTAGQRTAAPPRARRAAAGFPSHWGSQQVPHPPRGGWMRFSALPRSRLRGADAPNKSTLVTPPADPADRPGRSGTEPAALLRPPRAPGGPAAPGLCLPRAGPGAAELSEPRRAARSRATHIVLVGDAPLLHVQHLHLRDAPPGHASALAARRPGGERRRWGRLWRTQPGPEPAAPRRARPSRPPAAGGGRRPRTAPAYPSQRGGPAAIRLKGRAAPLGPRVCGPTSRGVVSGECAAQRGGRLRATSPGKQKLRRPASGAFPNGACGKSCAGQYEPSAPSSFFTLSALQLPEAMPV